MAGRLGLVLALSLVAVAQVGVGCSGAPHAGSTRGTGPVFSAAAALEPARFAVAPGWHVGAKAAHACVGVSPARCTTAESWAATTRWRDCGWCLPHRTVAAFGRDGIAIELSLSREKRLSWEKPLRPPFQVRASDVGGLEGLSSSTGVVQKIGLVRGLTAYYFVFFGRSHPTARQLARANAELRTAHFRGATSR